MKNYKILFTDLDGTLIKTKSGETFPKGIWDMEFRFEVLDTIKEMQPLAVLIATNQGGIESGFVSMEAFEIKMKYIMHALREYLDVFSEYAFCPSNDKDYYYRKPNTGMLVSLLHSAEIHWYGYKNITKEDCIMICDASGKEGQFSDIDKKTAENFGIDYMDVDDFVQSVYLRDKPL